MGRNEGEIEGLTIEVLERERRRKTESVSRLKMIVGETEQLLQSKSLTVARSSPPRPIVDCGG